MSSPGRSVPKFLFCYACRPNFHHKYLTLSDPPLSACGEALISRHTCADRPEILKLEPRMRVFSRVRVDALMHVGAKRRSTRLAVRHSSCFSQRLSAASRSGRRTWLRKPPLLKSVSLSGGQTLLCLCTPPFSLSASSCHRSWVRWGKESQ